ncbi:hypothetical protein DNH61_04140 [Paenibacillus sambharensis]|uniref:DUF4179 domain-containing protein n=1 Tax=Paenibacillus sambharensis TaxID=1803190 RepID=A0A2W1LA27_9BACL|nr:DUF4179 domain-containing protein [Paenibacillus sambharensis]PZD97088.1 hypothetical protein DNH61_04140 [Paenibacillus sambharensis]
MNRVNIDEEIKPFIEDSPHELPDMIKNRIDHTLASLPPLTSKRKQRLTRTIAYVSTAAVIFAFCIIGSGFISPAMANTLKQIPFIESVFKLAGDLGLQTAEDKSLTTPIQQSATIDGVTITITEVFYDGSRLSVGIVQHSPDGIKEILEVEPVINGKSTHFPGSGSDMAPSNDNITDTTVIQYMPEYALPDSFDLKLLVFLKGMEDKRFEFDFKVNKTESRIVTPMVTKTHQDLTATVQEIQISPVTIGLVMNTKLPEGKTVPQYALFDERGIRLQTIHEHGYGEKLNNMMNMTSELKFTPLESTPKSVTVKAYYKTIEKTVDNSVRVDRMPSVKEPIILQQGELGRFEITQIERLPDKTIVHYRADGNDPYGMVFWINDDSGTTITHRGLQVVNQENYEFVVEFPVLSQEQSIHFVTNGSVHIDYINELEMTIPLHNE